MSQVQKRATMTLTEEKAKLSSEKRSAILD